MRKVDRTTVPIPAELNSLDCINHRNEIIRVPGTAARPDFYKGKVLAADGTKIFTVRIALKSLYKNKCAYCECDTHVPKIDHHRPKGRIVGEPLNTPGYYWLVYEWTNLLPSCTDCNGIGAKASNYPVVGPRRSSHPVVGNPPVPNFLSFTYDDLYNAAESPQLLHPEYTDPEQHFEFDHFGVISGKTIEGNVTINVCKLDRADLNGWRKAIYMEHFNKIKSLLNDHLNNDNLEIEQYIESKVLEWLLQLISESKDEDLQYTLFRKVLYREIEYFFIEPLEPVLQPIIRDILIDSIGQAL